MVTLMSFAVTIYFGHWIKAVLPVNLLLLLLFVQAIYAAIRWYVKGWRKPEDTARDKRAVNYNSPFIFHFVDVPSNTTKYH